MAEDIQALRQDILKYAESRSGKVYAPIPHPALEDIPYHHGPERFDMIRDNIPAGAETGLDIGSHWGYFAHCLESIGLQVTAVENDKNYLSFLYRIRSLCGARFSVFPHSVFELGATHFDVVLALNVFHHFIKTESRFRDLVSFLRTLSCDSLFFQSHDPQEGQMRDAYANPGPEDFVALVSESAGLPVVELLGVFGRRHLYRLSH